jgi:hypothetical protein
MNVFLAIFVLFSASVSLASVEAATAVRQYDDGKTQVTSPKIDLKGTFLGDRASVGAGYTMDVVSSASSDVTSYGSKKISEKRQEVSADLGWLADGGSYSWSVVNSEENDYKSTTYGVGGTRELFEKNTVLGIGMGYGDDTILSSGNKTFKKFMTNNAYSFSITQVLSKISVLQLLYDLRIESGYLASPYRKARLRQSSGTIVGVPENHPRTRNRNSFAIKYNYFVKDIDLSFASTVRFYYDSWGVTSGTLEERVTKNFSKTLSLALSLRYYSQLQASFYKDIYSSDPGPFYTGNKTLSTNTSYQLGLRPLISVSDEIKFYVKGEYYVQDFANHTDLGRLSDSSDDKKLKLEAFIVGAGIESKF